MCYKINLLSYFVCDSGTIKAADKGKGSVQYSRKQSKYEWWILKFSNLQAGEVTVCITYYIYQITSKAI